MRWIVMVLLALTSCKKSMSAADWRASTEPRMIAAFCEQKQFFRQCFDIDEATCTATATETIKRCFDSTTIPDTIDEQSGRETGSRVGGCAGEAFETAMVAKRKHGGKCDDASAWMQQ